MEEAAKGGKAVCKIWKGVPLLSLLVFQYRSLVCVCVCVCVCVRVRVRLYFKFAYPHTQFGRGSYRCMQACCSYSNIAAQAVRSAINSLQGSRLFFH